METQPAHRTERVGTAPGLDERRAGRFAEALIAWRTAVDLLPPGSAQYTTVSARVAEELGRKGPPKTEQSG